MGASPHGEAPSAWAGPKARADTALQVGGSRQNIALGRQRQVHSQSHVTPSIGPGE